MLYFAYGSNIYTKRLIDRVGAAKFLGVGILEGYELRFNKIGKDATAKANIIPKSGSFVEGVVYRLTDQQFTRLDPYEQGYSKKKVLIIMNKAGVIYNAVTYVAQPSFVQDNIKPDNSYLQLIKKGRIEHGLEANLLGN